MNKKLIERLNEDAAEVLRRTPDAPVVNIPVSDQLRKRLGLPEKKEDKPA